MPGSAFIIILTFTVATIALMAVGSYYTACVLTGVEPPAVWKLLLLVAAVTVAADIGAIALVFWRSGK